MNNKLISFVLTKILSIGRPFQLMLVALAGLLVGWLLFHQPGNPPSGSEGKHAETHHDHTNQVWTCSMDPQIKMDKPGKCPICGMDLIPLVSNATASGDSSTLHLSSDAVQLANVETSIVGKQPLTKTLTLQGNVQADERLVQSQTAHFPGRIERLSVAFTGETVRKGQVLALLNSPELITAQQELLDAAKNRDVLPEAFEAAKARLRQWKLSENQLKTILQSGRVREQFPVLAGSSGIVTSKKVNTGDYVSPGTVLFELADLSRVWVLFDAYESDLPFLKIGDLIRFRLQSQPETVYQGHVGFIDPTMDSQNRVVRIRVEVANPGGKLKPGMFATGTVQATLSGYKDKLVIPSSAVLWTGKRSVVYVKQPGETGVFRLREIELGLALSDSYVVLSGLSEGEEVVTEGAFSVDAAAQLEGKPSMLNH